MSSRLGAPVEARLRDDAEAARTEIASGALRGASLLDRLLAIPYRDRDAWVDEVLGIEAPPPDALDLPRGSVPYLPCAVEEIIAMTRAVAIAPDDTDTIVDLGSGLGRVAMLVHLLTGAATLGIEIQELLVARARERAAALCLSRVSFVCANAAQIALPGSIFFLYAPFNGAMLTAVLAQLEMVARRSAIVIAAVDVELHDVPWLRPREPAPTLSLALYDSDRVMR